MKWTLALLLPLCAWFAGGWYAPLALGMVMLAAWRYGLLGGSLVGFWAALWAALPAGLWLPSLTVPHVVVGCLAGASVERRPVVAPLQRAVFALGLSFLGLVLQLGLSGCRPAEALPALLSCWSSWALWSAGAFFLLSSVFPARKW